MTSKVCWVSGRVQGVYYRGTTVMRARELGIRGYVRKSAAWAGSMVLAQGEMPRFAALIEWLWIGSSARESPRWRARRRGDSAAGGIYVRMSHGVGTQIIRTRPTCPAPEHQVRIVAAAEAAVIAGQCARVVVVLLLQIETQDREPMWMFGLLCTSS